MTKAAENGARISNNGDLQQTINGDLQQTINLDLQQSINDVVDKCISRGLAITEQAKTMKVKNSKKAIKGVKDPNRPKRSLSAFFLFMDDFRKSFREHHPLAKGLGVVAKAAGDKWKEMSKLERAPYIAKAREKKLEYTKAMLAYKLKQDENRETVA